jgi:hypothetical protein
VLATRFVDIEGALVAEKDVKNGNVAEKGVRSRGQQQQEHRHELNVLRHHGWVALSMLFGLLGSMRVLLFPLLFFLWPFIWFFDCGSVTRRS